MALTRKFLSALGIDTEKIDEIIAAHAETVDSLKEQRDAYKTDADKYAVAAAQVIDLKKQVNAENPYEAKYNELKAEYDAYKTTVEEEKTNAAQESEAKYNELKNESESKYAALQAEYEKYKTDTEAENTSKYNQLQTEYDAYKTETERQRDVAKRQDAYRGILQRVGVSPKRIDAVLRLANLDAIKFDDEGDIENADEVEESAKSEWADYIVTETQRGAETEKPPQSNGGKMSKEDILNIKDTSERQRAIAENHELFGF